MRRFTAIVSSLGLASALGLALVQGAPARASEVEVEGGAPPAAAAPSADAVARAQFTSAVVEREPTDQLTSLPSGAARLVFFTELRDLAGQTVVHRWERDGEVRAEVPFSVGGPRWRVWSTKELLPEEGGVWTVSVVDDAGTLLASRTLDAPPASTP